MILIDEINKNLRKLDKERIAYNISISLIGTDHEFRKYGAYYNVRRNYDDVKSKYDHYRDYREAINSLFIDYMHNNHNGTVKKFAKFIRKKYLYDEPKRHDTWFQKWGLLYA